VKFLEHDDHNKLAVSVIRSVTLVAMWPHDFEGSLPFFCLEVLGENCRCVVLGNRLFG